MNNKDMPAMPTKVVLSEAVKSQRRALGLSTDDIYHEGLTKREHFAGLAMQSILDRYNPWEEGDFDSSNYDTVAKNCIGMADALLKALED